MDIHIRTTVFNAVVLRTKSSSKTPGNGTGSKYKAADLRYEVINRPYERKSVIVTTNRPFKEWNEVFPKATCIVTLLDRLLHHAEVTVIEGDSYRVSELETAARRRKK